MQLNHNEICFSWQYSIFVFWFAFVERKIKNSSFEFRKELELMVEELETEDILIKGKCSGCS